MSTHPEALPAPGNEAAPPRAGRPTPDALRRVHLACAALAALVGGLTLAGWAFDVPVLRSVVPGLATMKPNTALGFMVAGASLWLWRGAPGAVPRGRRRAAVAGGLIVAALGLLTLSEYVCGWNLGLDEWLFRDAPLSPFTSHPGRMALNTAACWTLAGLALALLEVETRRGGPPAEWLALAVAFIALTVICGYIYGVRQFVGPFSFAGMSLHTVAGFLALSVGTLTARPARGLMAHFTGGGPEVAVARELALSGTALFLVIGLLTERGGRAGWYEPKAEDALMLAASIAVFGFLILRAVRTLGRLDAARREAEAALRPSEERFVKAFNASPHLMTISTLDEGRYVAVNDLVLRATGYKREEMIGRTSAELGIFDHPEGRAPLVQAFAATGSVRDLEMNLRGKDGSLRAVLISAEIIELNGQRCILTTSNDITERKRAEAALRESREVLSLAMRSSRMGAWSRDVARGRVWWSEELEEIFGLPPGGFAGTMDGFHDLIHPDDRERVRQEVEAAVAARRDYVIEFRFRHADGGVRWMEGRGQAVYGADGQPQRLYGIGLDITERKLAEAERERLLEQERAARAAAEAARGEAEAATRAKDEFLAVVSHELRTPLNAILGWSHILTTRASDAALQGRAAEVIERSARQQLQLIEDLLDTARIISGKLKLDVRPVELVPVVTSALDVIRPAAEARGVELVSDLDPAAGQITGDVDRLQQVVWNLLSNAVKFTPAGGRVRVALRRDGPHVTVTVSDTGKGIEPDFLPHVFDRFRQFDSSASRRYGGLGLGLALVKHLTELHGGTVEAASEGEGRGATFTVRLPLRAVYAPPPSLARGRGAASRVDLDRLLPDGVPTLGGVRVLVADDETDARELVTLTLKEFGADVHAAASGAEARDALRAAGRGFDVFVCDIGMPGEDGYETLRRVRALGFEQGGAVPAVALTAFSRPEDRVRALQAGFQMHIAKPVDPGELLVVINALLGRAGAGANA